MKKGWALLTLGSVCTKIQDGAHQSPQTMFSEGGPGRFLYITSKNIRNNRMDLSNVSFVNQEFHDQIYPRCKPEVGDVLLTKDGANTGNVTLNTIGEPFSLLSSVCLIKTDPKQLVPGFLKYYIQSPSGLAQIIGQMNGAAIKRIILKDIKLATIPLPVVLEQQRIVAILDEAFEGIATAKANAEKNLQNAREVFDNYLQAVLSGGGEGWQTSNLGEVCVLKSGTTIPVEIERPEGDVPYVKVAEMSMPENMGGVTTSIRFINNKDIKSTWVIPAGAVIFPKRGGAIMTNKKRLLLVDACLDLNLMAVIPTAKITSDFLYLYFLSVDMRKLGTGSSIPQINNYDIAPLEISYPKSKGMQLEVTEALRAVESECQQLIVIYQNKITALNDLKQSLLYRAFNGDL